LVRREQFAEAERHYRAALQAKPNAETYNGLGFVLWRQGRLDEAVAQFQEAIRADPAYAGAYNNLAAILVEQGKLEEAAFYYRRLVRHHPSAAAHNQLGAVLMRLGEMGEARGELQKALEMDPGHSDARRNLEALHATERSLEERR
jgi:Flp pilus assembly protein TadD